MRVPADCLIIDSYHLMVNESNVSILKSDVSKQTLTDTNFNSNPNPFLFSSTTISKGFATAVVCSLGSNAYFRKDMEKMTFEDFPTPTQMRLQKIIEQIYFLGMLVCAMIGTCLLTQHFLKYRYVLVEEDIFSGESF